MRVLSERWWEIDWNERFRGKEVDEMWLEFRSTVG